MTGTIINVFAILLGGTAGVFLGGRFPERIRQTIMVCLGLFTLANGISLFIKSQNMMVVVLSLVIGTLLGEWWKIEDLISRFGGWLESKVSKSDSPSKQELFIKGFLTSSLLFCIGPLAILGSIQDGLSGDYNLLLLKAIIDGFAALAFATTLGIGVLFSVIPILIYQGGITLLASQAQSAFTDAMMLEMSATGGIILMAIAFSDLLEIKPIRSGNILPALFIAPLLVALLGWLQLTIP